MLSAATAEATPKSITAAVVGEPGASFQLSTVVLGQPREDEIVVKLVAVGMCHTDIAVCHGHIPTPLPAVLGHEGAGHVVAKGSGVTSLEIGDPVVLTYLSCGECRECRSGSPASCASLFPLCFGGARPDGSHALCAQDGTALHDRFFGQSSFATYAIAHERNAITVPADAPLELLGPLGCGITTGAGAVWNELDVQPGSSIAIYGAGAVGLSALLAARTSGAKQIIAIDIVGSRLELAQELGATHVIDSSSCDVVEAVREKTGGGTDYALDTTGINSVIRNAVRALRQRGLAALVAMTQPDLELDMPDLLGGCKSVRGVIEGGGSAHRIVPRILGLYRTGKFPFDRLVRFYPFAEINEAVRDSRAGTVIKPILKF
jgi:aryl-alcohol dehydrogenase